MSTLLTPPAPPTRTTYRCTFTLPIPLATAISQVAKRLNVSQSALLVQLLDGPLADLVRVLEQLPPDDGQPISPEQVRRFKGASAAIVRQRVQEAQQAADTIEPPGQKPLL